MSKIRPGHKQNSFLNGEWGKHVRGFLKKHTSGVRRMRDRMIIKKELEGIT